VKRLLIDGPKKKPTSCGQDKDKDKGIWDARLDFSANNNGKTTYCWVAAIKKKGKLEDVYRRAQDIGSPVAKKCDDEMRDDSENDRADIESETDGEAEEDGERE
jgi:hypothetical protein